MISLSLPVGTFYSSLHSWRSEIHGTQLQISWNAYRRPRLESLNCCASHTAENYQGPEDNNTNTGNIAIERIAEKLRRLRQGNEVKGGGYELGHGSNGPKYRVGHGFVRSRSKSEHLEPPRDLEEAEVISVKKKREFVPTLAQLTIPEQEIKRLRTIGLYSGRTVRIGKDGVTPGAVDAIHYRWRKSEVTRIKCGGKSRMNMKKTHDILEKTTGGLVVWRAGDIMILYRGTDYRHSCLEASSSLGVHLESVDNMGYAYSTNSLNISVERMDKNLHVDASGKDKQGDMVIDVTVMDSIDISDIEVNQTNIYPLGERESERKLDRLLDGRGPHCIHWSSSYDPLLSDADLLPVAVLRCMKPFRLLPSGVKDNSNETKISSLQNLPWPVPPYSGVGINYQLQGLASAIIKLWEQNEIIEIAHRHGVQSNNSQTKAVTKCLTGGTLLSRNNEFIFFHRGNSFPSFHASHVLAERKVTKLLQEKEKEAQLKLSIPGKNAQSPGRRKQWKKRLHKEDENRMQEETSKAKQVVELRSIDSKLTFAISKKIEVEKELYVIERGLQCVQPPAYQETITIEERLMLRKIGLKMNAFILLGRSGVFDDVIENMHLQWKYRKLVKIVTNEKSFVQVKDLARILEYESEGILVAVDSVEKGHAIIVYRGKNYQCPTMLRPDSLLNRKVALRRWNAIQRRESLRLELLQVERDINRLNFHLSKAQDLKEEITEQVTEEINSAYPSENMEESTMQFKEELDSDSLSDLVENEHQEAFLGLYHSSNKNENTHITFQGVTLTTKLDKTNISTAEHNNQKGKVYSEVYRAEPLSNRERRELREEAKKMPKRAQFCVGKKNIASDLAQSIRSRFKKYALVKVDVKGRAPGTSVAEIAFQLEEATGSLLVHREPGKVVLYRGWPEGEEKISHAK